jgi:pullulanase/glycogen debranching enzyme
MKYLNLKKITAVVLSIGMVFSSSAVTGFAADNSKKIATIPNSYINKVAEDIDNKYFYDGTYVDDWGHTRKGRQLGATYTKESTEFLLWAPAATYVTVNIYATGDDNDSNARDIGTYALEKMLVNGEWNGLWIITLVSDWGGLYYDYTITTTDVTHIGSDRTTKYKIQDPYSVAVSKDGKRSYITDTSSVSPEGWVSDRHVYVDSTKANTVYKISVKDFSSDTASGMTAGGKYSAFTEKGAKVNSAGELVSGIDYLKELGVTTVQLAPFADFDGDSEYEILNYNVPEASYASNPSDSKTVIKECKEMIQALHSAGFSVVMEMPYTHASEENPLEKSVPRFYYRLNTDGTRYTTNTGYDNELATERKMYRSYMVNSMKYWAEEYHVDGFSLDLIDCVNVKYKGSSHVYKWLDEIKTSLAKEDANLVIWGDNYTKEERQNKTSSYDEIIGSTGGTYGERNEKAVKIYKQKAAMKYAKPGTLFMDGGEEMCNSVEGRTLADSSYVEWKDSAEYADVVSYYRGLMEIRKAFSPLAKSQTIKNSEAYVLTGTKDDEWNTMAVLNNESDVSKEITIPVQGRAATDWVVIANGESAGVVSLGEVAGSVITVPAYTTMILVDKESFDDVAVTSSKGKVIVNYVIKDSDQKLRESITLQGTSGTNYAVPDIKIPSGYNFLSKTGDEKGVYTSETQTVTYYYNAINPDTVVNGIKNNGVYCEKAQFKVTSSDYTQVMAGNKTLTPDADGIYTVSAADGTQTITLTDNEGYSIYLSVTVNANHTIDNSDCTKESICSVCGKIFLAQANHKFSDTWTKDDTYHWKVCENDGCMVTTTKTKHSGTDDGDCTTPVICECGEIVTAAKSEHIYGEWKSNGNGTHTHKCTTAGCTIEETESCVGGAATCKKRAVCTDCNAEYGTLNPANHSGNQVWVQTEKTHQKKYDCCGAEVTNIEDHIWDNGHCTVCGYDCIHKGGEATCTQKAVCDTCNSEYGEINADNHTGTEKWTQTATTHEKKYDCCGKVTIAQENHNWKDGACETCGYVCVHSGGEAICTKGAVCETCGKEYTDKDMANHSGKVVWVQTEKTHKQAYDCCDKEVSTSEAHGWKNGVCTVCDYQCKHAGGSATCVKKAVCTICSEEYGTYNMSIHEGLKSVAAKAATRTDEGNIEYWYCKDCDRYYIKQDGLVEIEKSQTVVAKITDTTSSDDTGKGGKTETVKEQTPDTGDNKRVFAWLLMFIIGGAAAGLTIKGKKTEN